MCRCLISGPEVSSRSHALFRIVLETRELVPADGDEGDDDGARAPKPHHRPVRASQLYLVDLAGSEARHLGHTASYYAILCHSSTSSAMLTPISRW